ncbi:MAG: hypothetical protein KAS65_08390 [Candidatus Aminicenantes bacterium]|nr:hypothetical protein [Candidatus Aminicenantes bacterium]
MKILINDQMIEIFEGARLQDAVRKYSETELKQIEKEDKKIVDRKGNPLALDGELSDGEYFYIIEC